MNLSSCDIVFCVSTHIHNNSKHGMQYSITSIMLWSIPDAAMLRGGEKFKLSKIRTPALTRYVRRLPSVMAQWVYFRTCPAHSLANASSSIIPSRHPAFLLCSSCCCCGCRYLYSLITTPRREPPNQSDAVGTPHRPRSPADAATGVQE